MVSRLGVWRTHRSFCRTGTLNRETLARINQARRDARAIVRATNLATGEERMIDPRTAFATATRFPHTKLSNEWPDEALAKEPLGQRSALVALAHDPKLDDPGLIIALKSPCFYIGALGSNKTHAGRLERLKHEGFSEQDLSRIHGPIGLDIGARSPAEIAVAILAEVTQTLRGSKRAQAIKN